MAKKSFNYDTDKAKKRAKSESSRGESGSGINYMKLDKFKTKILILPPTPGSEAGVFKRTMVHEIRKGNKIITRSARYIIDLEIPASLPKVDPVLVGYLNFPSIYNYFFRIIYTNIRNVSMMHPLKTNSPGMGFLNVNILHFEATL